MVETARCKGVGLKSLVRSVEVLKGKDVAQRCLDNSSVELRDGFKYGKIVASGWYPLTFHRDLHIAIAKTLATGPEFARTLGNHSTRHDVETVYKLASLFFSPQTLLKQSMRLLKLYYENTTVEVPELDAGQGVLRFAGFVGYNRLCWEDVTGGVAACLECAGAKDVRMTTLEGGGDDDTSLTLRASWHG